MSVAYAMTRIPHILMSSGRLSYNYGVQETWCCKELSRDELEKDDLNEICDWPPQTLPKKNLPLGGDIDRRDMRMRKKQLKDELSFTYLMWN